MNLEKFKKLKVVAISTLLILCSSLTVFGDESQIYLTGDLMCQFKQQSDAKITEGYYNFDKTFSLVKDIFSDGDLVVGNLETMISKSNVLGEKLKLDRGKPYLNSPVDFLKSIKKAGYDLVVTANNHNCDTGKKGLLETMSALNEEGLEYTGYFENEETSRYKLVNLGNMKLGIISYATYFNTKENRFSFFDRMHMLNRYSSKKIKKDVQAIKKAGADFIIAYNHWGSEYVNEENSLQRKYAIEMANSGVDYIVGSHPHALQPYDEIETKDGRKVPVFYSLGNFTSHMISRDITSDTGIVSLKLSKNEAGKVVFSHEFIPCKMLPSYKNENYVLVPCVNLKEEDADYKLLKSANESIGNIIGSKIKINS